MTTEAKNIELSFKNVKLRLSWNKYLRHLNG